MTVGGQVGATRGMAPRDWPVLLLLVATALTSGACASRQRAAAETAVAKALISDDQETQLGMQVQQELQKQNVRYLDDPQVTAYVRAITDKILPLAEKDRPGVKWQVKVIDDPNVVNAFATPGGFLYVYTGLLLAAADDAEVAGVLGHEAGHVVGRHSARQMVDAFGLQAVASLALGQNPGLLSQLAAGVAGKGAMLANSRGDETEADEYGARYTSSAGYDPRGLVTFFQKLQAQEGKQPKALTWLSDHPATPDRISHVEDYIRSHKLGGSGGRNPAATQAVQARVRQVGKTPVKAPAA
jgi:beta-barrel assembly-enhancing protease